MSNVSDFLGALTIASVLTLVMIEIIEVIKNKRPK